MPQFTDTIWPPLQNVPEEIPPTLTGGFAVAPNFPNMIAAPSAIPPSMTIWSPAPPPVNMQTLLSPVTTQLEINAEFNIQDLRLEAQAPTPA